MEDLIKNLRDAGKQYGFTPQDLKSRVRLPWDDGQHYSYTIEGLQLSPVVVVRDPSDGSIYRFPVEPVLKAMGRSMPSPTPTPAPKGSTPVPTPTPKAPEKPAPGKLSTQHAQMDAFVAMLKAATKNPDARINILLKGPAGSGKTTAGEKAAVVLGYDLKTQFFCMSMGPQTSKADLLGYMDANGKYVKGVMYDAFVNGGFVMLDELDNSNPSVLTTLNSMLSNDWVQFPCGMRKKHKKFLCVGSANTWGKGADSQYVGRQQLDAATLNRFTFVSWDYDESFERHLVVKMMGEDKKQQALGLDWCMYVQSLRAAAFRTGVRVVLSPRQSIFGATFLKDGMARDMVEQSVVWNPIGADDKQKILQNV